VDPTGGGSGSHRTDGAGEHARGPSCYERHQSMNGEWACRHNSVLTPAASSPHVSLSSAPSDNAGACSRWPMHPAECLVFCLSWLNVVTPHQLPLQTSIHMAGQASIRNDTRTHAHTCTRTHLSLKGFPL